MKTKNFVRKYIEFNIPSCEDILAIASDILSEKEIKEKIIFKDYPDAFNFKVKRYMVKEKEF